MQIRDHYIESFNRISNKFGESQNFPSNHIITEDVTLPAAIGYTRKFIIESTEQHFRYDYYREKIDNALTTFNIERAKKIIHLDLGCGPGLFSWVIQDCMLKRYEKNPFENGYEKKAGDPEFIGYDHAQEMIHLANLFQEYLPVKYKFDGYFKIDEIRSMLNSRNFSDCSCIVTLGYVLIQVKNNKEALQNFAQIILDLFPAKSCILIAVDAYYIESRRQDFRNTCKKLLAALIDAGISAKPKPIGNSGSTMYASLSR